MSLIYQHILEKADEKLLAVLIDPDKITVAQIPDFIKKVNQSITTHIFIGGSLVDDTITDTIAKTIKQYTTLPLLIFPGDVNQITNHADAILFLSLVSGRNPDYLIGKHVEAVSKLAKTNLEVIPTAYLLIENGKETAVQRVTQTQPLAKNDIQIIVDTAKAGELLGMQLVYLEAGSGAQEAIEAEIISAVKNKINVPLIVGGGIKTKQQLENAYKAGANLVVIGTAFEEDEAFFEDIKSGH